MLRIPPLRAPLLAALGLGALLALRAAAQAPPAPPSPTPRPMDAAVLPTLSGGT